MRWQHIKTVMIVILLAVNLWLGGLLINRNLMQNYLDKDVLQNTVEILGRDGILLSVDQLDPGRRDADLFSAPILDDYNMAVAEMLADSPAADVFPTPSGGIRVLTETGETLVLDEGFGLFYLPSGQERDVVAQLRGRLLTEGNAVSPGSFGLRELRRAVESLLSESVSGETASPARAQTEIVLAHRLGEYTLIRCRQTVDGREILGHVLDCLFAGDGTLLCLDGNWSFLPLSGNYSAPLYDQINILFMEKAAVDVLRERGDVQGALTLASLDLCYVLCHAEEADSRGDGVYYSPAWRICYTDGTERIYNAITGTPITGNAAET